MSITGGCDCNNIEITWHTTDYSVRPRACQCDYCSSKGAAYVTKSGTRFNVLIRSKNFHNEVHHGSQTATFHECTRCNQVLFVTSEIDGDLYGALNANHLTNKLGFSDPIAADFGNQTAEQKLERWRQNWCCPVLVSTLASDAN